MSFLDSVEKIRAKPEEEKRKIALMWALGITLFIFIVWLVATVHNVSSLSGAPEAQSNTPSPFAQIGDSFSKVFDSMSNIFNRAQTIQEATTSSQSY